MSSERWDSAVPVFSMPSVSSQLYQPFNQRENGTQMASASINSSISRHGMSSSPHRRPWPGRKVSQEEEAVNLGVLEWRRLQNWIGQEEAEVNKICSSPLFSPFHPSPKSSRQDSSICIMKSQSAITGSSSSTSSLLSKMKSGSAPSVEVEKPTSERRLSIDAALMDSWGRLSATKSAGGGEDNYSQSFRSIKGDNFHETIGRSSFETRQDMLPSILARVESKRMAGSPLKGTHPPRRSASPAKKRPEAPRKSSSPVGSVSDNTDAVLSRSSSRGRRSPVKQSVEEPRKRQEARGIVKSPLMNETSTKQALLKVSWKNGLPLLMFSSSDDNILVATMHKRGNSDMNICNCVYVIHTAIAVEVKKKNGAWLSQGTKHRKPEFTSKFVAELVVSSSERVSFDLSHRSTLREFVLLGDELMPTKLADAVSLSTSELAAIMVESSQQKSGSSNCGVLCDCKVCIPRIVAILPTGVHGFADAREPSTLIERWESGGSCDCGGWDEGCMLTILTNNSQAIKKSRSIQGHHQSVDRICGFNLFTEGEARKGKHSFSMVAFKEDMFTVEFRPSFPLLQAFAISIAMLHGRNAGDGVMRDFSVEDDSPEELSIDDFPLMSS